MAIIVVAIATFCVSYPLWPVSLHSRLYLCVCLCMCAHMRMYLCVYIQLATLSVVSIYGSLFQYRMNFEETGSFIDIAIAIGIINSYSCVASYKHRMVQYADRDICYSYLYSYRVEIRSEQSPNSSAGQMGHFFSMQSFASLHGTNEMATMHESICQHQTVTIQLASQ